MIRSGILLVCGFCVVNSGTLSADEPCCMEAVPERGRMYVPFSRIFHHNRPVLQRVASWICYRPAPAPPSAKCLLIRPVPVPTPPLYTYFPSRDVGHGSCAGCDPGIVEPFPMVYLDAPIVE